MSRAFVDPAYTKPGALKPGRGMFIAALIWLLLAAGGFFFEPLSLVWVIFALILLPFIVLDGLFLLLLTDRLEAQRDIKSSLALGVKAPVKLFISRSGKTKGNRIKGGRIKGNRGFLPVSTAIFDLYPSSMGESGVFPARLTLPKQRNKRTTAQQGEEPVVVFEYTLLPLERGEWEFSGLQFLHGSPLRFWRLNVSCACVSRGRTYPDFRKLRNAVEILGLLERTGQAPRKRGQGREFQSLRDYQEGDSVRDLDWRATSRRGKAIVREYQEEQDQQLVFLLDTGYRLHRLEEGRLQFESALEAALLLAYVALGHGASVAAASFGNVERWVAPRKGVSAFTALMHRLYDLKSAPVPSSPFSCLEEALVRLHRRSFIILLSNFREEDGESLSWILPRIEKRHLLLLVSLRERDALIRRSPATLEGAMETAAAFSYLISRRDLYRRWEHSGLLTLEAAPGDLSSSLINRYLQVKRSGRL
jgi:uncharacterized protein (DUF58 family)